MKERRAIVTRAIGINEMSEISHPLLKAYAEKCGADFVVISECKINIGMALHNEIFQCYDLLDKYDRIIVIDSDVVLNIKIPNIFEIVPFDSVGVVYEDVFSRKTDRRKRIKKVQEEYGHIGWESGYINTGFIVFSRIHKELFNKSERIWEGPGYDDVEIGYRINKHGFKVFELPYRFNHMSIFSETGRNWLKSYIIHYAGRGFYRRMDRVDQMKRDLHLINSYSRFWLSFVNILPRIRLFLIGFLIRLQNLKERFAKND